MFGLSNDLINRAPASSDVLEFHVQVDGEGSNHIPRAQPVKA